MGVSLGSALFLARLVLARETGHGAILDFGSLRLMGETREAGWVAQTDCIDDRKKQRIEQKGPQTWERQGRRCHDEVHWETLDQNG